MKVHQSTWRIQNSGNGPVFRKLIEDRGYCFNGTDYSSNKVLRAGDDSTPLAVTVADEVRLLGGNSDLQEIVQSSGMFKWTGTDFAFDYVKIPSGAIVNEDTKRWRDDAEGYQMIQKRELTGRLLNDGYKMRGKNDFNIFLPKLVELDVDGLVKDNGYVGYFIFSGYHLPLVRSQRESFSKYLEGIELTTPRPIGIPDVDSPLWFGRKAI